MTTLETVAAALRERRRVAPYEDIDLARAALEAIREPSQSALEAGEKHDEGGWGAPASAEVHWPAMIDAILNEGA